VSGERVALNLLVTDGGSGLKFEKTRGHAVFIVRAKIIKGPKRASIHKELC